MTSPPSVASVLSVGAVMTNGIYISNPMPPYTWTDLSPTVSNVTVNFAENYRTLPDRHAAHERYDLYVHRAYNLPYYPGSFDPMAPHLIEADDGYSTYLSNSTSPTPGTTKTFCICRCSQCLDENEDCACRMCVCNGRPHPDYVDRAEKKNQM